MVFVRVNKVNLNNRTDMDSFFVAFLIGRMLFIESEPYLSTGLSKFQPD